MSDRAVACLHVASGCSQGLEVVHVVSWEKGLLSARDFAWAFKEPCGMQGKGITASKSSSLLLCKLQGLWMGFKRSRLHFTGGLGYTRGCHASCRKDILLHHNLPEL